VILEWHVCYNCGKKLFRGFLDGQTLIEVKCDRQGCKVTNTITAKELPRTLEPDGQGGFIPVLQLNNR